MSRGDIHDVAGFAAHRDGGQRQCRLIERGEKRLDVVAARSGLGTAANLRPRLRRATGLSPSAYRRRFGSGGGEALVS